MHFALVEKMLESLRIGRPGVSCLLIEQSGSTPRKERASMWVYPDGAIEGAIGGGPMEYACINESMAIDHLG